MAKTIIINKSEVLNMKLTREDILKYATEDELKFLKEQLNTGTMEDSLKGLSIAINNKSWRAVELWLRDMLNKVQNLKGQRFE